LWRHTARKEEHLEGGRERKTERERASERERWGLGRASARGPEALHLAVRCHRRSLRTGWGV